MQRWISYVLGVAVIALAVVLMVKGLGPSKSGASAEADAGRAAAVADGGAATVSSAGGAVDLDGGFGGFPIVTPTYDPRIDGGVGYTMPDGTPPPPLPANAPKQVSFGIILFQYQGAQLAPATARTKQAAKELADKAAAEAKTDFHAAVNKGDQGFSFDSAGILYRGSLEPALEYVVFTLPQGGVSDVLDTPRGYAIFKRID